MNKAGRKGKGGELFLVISLLVVLFVLLYSKSPAIIQPKCYAVSGDCTVHSVDGNFFGINWVGDPCENIDYAKSMGYTAVFYKTGMENCANKHDISFYISDPEQKNPIAEKYWNIDLAKIYTTAEQTEILNYFAVKSSDTFPKNLATGWFFSASTFRPVQDFQRQSVIDSSVAAAIAKAKSLEDPSKNFLFAGYAWDVPQLAGDFWSGYQSLGGQQVTMNYWTGTGSVYKQTGISYQYNNYEDGKAAFYKKLFSETKKVFPNMQTIYEPNYVYSSFIQKIETRSDARELMPSLLCQEGGNSGSVNVMDFENDARIFLNGLITKDRMCSTSPNIFNQIDNVKVAGAAAVNGGWFTWFGRFGGTGNMPAYTSVTQVPDRLKLIRMIPAWDNLNGILLTKRNFDASKNIYTSDTSYISNNIIYSRKPNSKLIYVVFLNQQEGITLKATDTIFNIYKVDTLFRSTTTTTDLKNSNGIITLINPAGIEKGYIIQLS